MDFGRGIYFVILSEAKELMHILAGSHTREILQSFCSFRMTKRVLPKIIVIVGPTASGKTDLGIFLAKKFNGEIVNADSRQIYSEMNIGTGKPFFENKHNDKKRKTKISINCPIGPKIVVLISGVLHHLFDVARPDCVVTVAEWKQKAVKTIRAIARRGNMPMVVGGTGLYIKTLIENWGIPKVPPDGKLRDELEKELKKKGIGVLWKRLIKLDPKARDVVQSNNPRRVIRALEVCLATGIPFTAQRVQGPPLFRVLQIGISLPRKELYRRIDKRVDWQIKNGLIEETQRLIKKYSVTLPAMSGIGYRESADYLRNLSLIRANRRIRKKKILLNEAAQKIKFRTHDYARRQMTWFRRDQEIHWTRSRFEVARLVRIFLESK